MLYEVWHIDCGGVAFLSSHKFKSGDVLRAAHIQYPDGSKPKAGHQIKCGACGKTAGTRGLTLTPQKAKGISVDATKHRPNVSPPPTLYTPAERIGDREKVISRYEERRAAAEAMSIEAREKRMYDQQIAAMVTARAALAREMMSAEGLEALVTDYGLTVRFKWLWVFVKHTELLTRLRRAYRALRGS